MIFFILDLNKSISYNTKKYILFLFITLNILIFIDSYLQFLTGKNVFRFEIIVSIS